MFSTVCVKDCGLTRNFTAHTFFTFFLRRSSPSPGAVQRRFSVRAMTWRCSSVAESSLPVFSILRRSSGFSSFSLGSILGRGARRWRTFWTISFSMGPFRKELEGTALKQAPHSVPSIFFAKINLRRALMGRRNSRSCHTYPVEMFVVSRPDGTLLPQLATKLGRIVAVQPDDPVHLPHGPVRDRLEVDPVQRRLPGVVHPLEHGVVPPADLVEGARL
mmetsp:Transcript_25214/g.58253  ORF Transcript_25214/g.58253 Transcript_25214/m.58253 type:complete len:218 (+) Transcript_25214:440-1093(+)